MVIVGCPSPLETVLHQDFFDHDHKSPYEKQVSKTHQHRVSLGDAQLGAKPGRDYQKLNREDQRQYEPGGGKESLRSGHKEIESEKSGKRAHEEVDSQFRATVATL